MTIKARLLPWAWAMVFAVVAASCGNSAASAPSPTVCDDVSSDLGGCTATRHEYRGTTCDEVAREWAAVLDESVIAVINGPDSVAEQARSVRLRQAIVITTVDADRHLESLGLAGGCHAPAFLATAEPMLSPELRAGVGRAMYDGDPLVGYQEWLDDVRKVVAVIEDEQ